MKRSQSIGGQCVSAEVRQITDLADLCRLDIAPGFSAITRSEGLREMFENVLAVRAVIGAAVQRSLLLGYTVDLPFLPVPMPTGELHRRWSKVPDARELGALEVARPFRGQGIARQLLEGLLVEGRLDRCIVIAEGLQWHWDLTANGLGAGDCRASLLSLFSRAGFRRYDTDEPEVSYSPANFLVARVGPQAPESSKRAFAAALFTGDRECAR